MPVIGKTIRGKTHRLARSPDGAFFPTCGTKSAHTIYTQSIPRRMRGEALCTHCFGEWSGFVNINEDGVVGPEIRAEKVKVGDKFVIRPGHGSSECIQENFVYVVKKPGPYDGSAYFEECPRGLQCNCLESYWTLQSSFVPYVPPTPEEIASARTLPKIEDVAALFKVNL